MKSTATTIYQNTVLADCDQRTTRPTGYEKSINPSEYSSMNYISIPSRRQLFEDQESKQTNRNTHKSLVSQEDVRTEEQISLVPQKPQIKKYISNWQCVSTSGQTRNTKSNNNNNISKDKEGVTQQQLDLIGTRSENHLDSEENNGEKPPIYHHTSNTKLENKANQSNQHSTKDRTDKELETASLQDRLRLSRKTTKKNQTNNVHQQSHTKRQVNHDKTLQNNKTNLTNSSERLRQQLSDTTAQMTFPLKHHGGYKEPIEYELQQKYQLGTSYLAPSNPNQLQDPISRYVTERSYDLSNQFRKDFQDKLNKEDNYDGQTRIPNNLQDQQPLREEKPGILDNKQHQLSYKSLSDLIQKPIEESKVNRNHSISRQQDKLKK